jgi:outer membrane protein assembly factor BamD (BamD/ComL family)
MNCRVLSCLITAGFAPVLSFSEPPEMLARTESRAGFSEPLNQESSSVALSIVRLDLESLYSKWLRDDGVERGESSQFEAGISKMRKHEYPSARKDFQSLISAFPDSKLGVPAYWAIGLAFYEEGGIENLQQALDQFKNFIIFMGQDEQQELPAAAQLNIAVIHIQLMKTYAKWRDSKHAVRAEEALESFLTRWPDSVYAEAAKTQLDLIKSLLASPR